MTTLWILLAVSSGFGDDIKIAEYFSQQACRQGMAYHQKTELYPRHELVCIRSDLSPELAPPAR